MSNSLHDPYFSRVGRSHFKDKGWLLLAPPAIWQAVKCSVLPSALVFRVSFLSVPWNLWHIRNKITFLFSLFEWSIEFTDINIHRHICIYGLIHIHKYTQVYTNIFCLFFFPVKILACLKLRHVCLGRPKPTWSWIWQWAGKATRRTSTRVSTANGK